MKSGFLVMTVSYLCLGLLLWLEQQDNRQLKSEVDFWKQNSHKIQGMCDEAIEGIRRANDNANSLIETANELKRQRDEYKAMVVARQP